MFEILETCNYAELWHHAVLRMAVVLVCWSFVFVANIVDYSSGISKARALGEKIESGKMRRTFAKLSDYYRVLIFGLLFDLMGGLFTFYKLPFISILVSATVIFIECKSVIENSRLKKSHAADIPKVIKEIIQCSKKEDAEKLLDLIIKAKETNK